MILKLQKVCRGVVQSDDTDVGRLLCVHTDGVRELRLEVHVVQDPERAQVGRWLPTQLYICQYDTYILIKYIYQYWFKSFEIIELSIKYLWRYK